MRPISPPEMLPLLALGCAHCWHYHANAAGSSAYERCCWCAERRAPGVMPAGSSHGPYAFAIADNVIQAS